MNSFLFYGLILFLLFCPVSGWSQTGVSPADPVSPLALLGNPSDTASYVQVNYSNPYGISSLMNISLKLNKPVPGGLLIADVETIGIPGYYEYLFGFGYGLIVAPGLLLGLNLDAVLAPPFGSIRRQFHVGSSVFGMARFSASMLSCFYIDNWTSLWNSQSNRLEKPRFSICINTKTRGDVTLISGLSYTKSRKPIIRFGVSILADARHTIIAGLQSGPPGFWTGYKFSNNRFDVLFTLEAGSFFGLEPASSFRYSMNQ